MADPKPTTEPAVAAPKASVGRIVRYHVAAGTPYPLGGNDAAELPAIITAVWPDGGVNLKVFCDAEPDKWVPGVVEGTEPGQWSWPPR